MEQQNGQGGVGPHQSFAGCEILQGSCTGLQGGILLALAHQVQVGADGIRMVQPTAALGVGFFLREGAVVVVVLQTKRGKVKIRTLIVLSPFYSLQGSSRSLEGHVHGCVYELGCTVPCPFPQCLLWTCSAFLGSDPGVELLWTVEKSRACFHSH